MLAQSFKTAEDPVSERNAALAKLEELRGRLGALLVGDHEITVSLTVEERDLIVDALWTHRGEL